jgi:uncharacterized protein (DUF169 family)
MRKSKIAEAIKLSTYPIAILKTNQIQKDALQIQKGGACVVAFLKAAAQGKIITFCETSEICRGGKVGLGFCKLPDVMQYFLSTGDVATEGEFYKKSPKLAKAYIDGLPKITSSQYITFKPYDFLEETEVPEAILFLVNADQLSGLVTLANFDRADQNNVQISFGSGCSQSILYVLNEQETDSDICMIGLTDPSARKVIDKDILSFSIPYHRFLEMEQNVSDSFLVHKTWKSIYQRQ